VIDREANRLPQDRPPGGKDVVEDDESGSMPAPKLDQEGKSPPSVEEENDTLRASFLGSHLDIKV
jgi:hypothetical protein